MSTAHPTASMGWCLCGQCEAPFLSVCGARVRCPACGHVFTVETVTLAKPGQFDESKPSGKQWLLRIEIRCARQWAEHKAAANTVQGECGAGFAHFFRQWEADAQDYLCAWKQVRALRFGQAIAFSDAREKVSGAVK